MSYTFDMYGAILIVHIIGAIATGALAIYACTAMILGNAAIYRRVALVLGMIATFEVVTGTALAVLSANITIASVCDNIAYYLVGVAVVEALLFMRMRGVRIRFPFAQTLAPIGVSLALMFSGLILGF